MEAMNWGSFDVETALFSFRVSKLDSFKKYDTFFKILSTVLVVCCANPRFGREKEKIC